MERTRRRGRNVLDLNRGKTHDAHELAGKSIPIEIDQHLDQIRAGNRHLDHLVRTTPGLNPSTRRTQLAYPTQHVAPLKDPRMARRLPEPDELRRPASDRQIRERHRTKRAAQDHLAGTEHAALADFISGAEKYRDLNRKLTRAIGNVTDLDEADRRYAGRIDRAISAYERLNNRTHRVYARLRLPSHINHSNLDGYIRNEMHPGRILETDRYAAAAHNLHEVEPAEADRQRTVILEITTRRGIYLGGAHAGTGGSGHLLPRGMRFGVKSAHQAGYARPDGTCGQALVVQLVDIDAMRLTSCRV